MKHLPLALLAIALTAAGCSPSSPSAPAAAAGGTIFTADLRPANEVPPISNAENTGSGTATITLNTTKDAAGNVTAATATFVVSLSGFPNGTPINIAHIHQAASGTNGSIVISTTLASGDINLTTGSGTFTRTGVTVTPVDIANQMLANPAGFYFNVHSTLNPGGVARGQLVRTN